MQALLEEWRNELARKPLAMSQKEACAVLGVNLDEGQEALGQKGQIPEDALMAAYRSLLLLSRYDLHSILTA